MLELIINPSPLSGFQNNKTSVLIHLTQWQYWWWYWFSYIWSLYFLIIMRVLHFRSFKFRPRLVTSFRSHAKWGDFIACILPVMWCTNIIINANFLLRLVEWQAESSLLTIKIRGKQWYWIYKIEAKTLFDVATMPKNIGTNKWYISTPNERLVADDFLRLTQLRAQKVRCLKMWESTKKNFPHLYEKVRYGSPILSNTFKTSQYGHFNNSITISKEFFDVTDVNVSTTLRETQYWSRLFENSKSLGNFIKYRGWLNTADETTSPFDLHEASVYFVDTGLKKLQKNENEFNSFFSKGVKSGNIAHNIIDLAKACYLDTTNVYEVEERFNTKNIKFTSLLNDGWSFIKRFGAGHTMDNNVKKTLNPKWNWWLNELIPNNIKYYHTNLARINLFDEEEDVSSLGSYEYLTVNVGKKRNSKAPLVDERQLTIAEDLDLNLANECSLFEESEEARIKKQREIDIKDTFFLYRSFVDSLVSFNNTDYEIITNNLLLEYIKNFSIKLKKLNINLDSDETFADEIFIILFHKFLNNCVINFMDKIQAGDKLWFKINFENIMEDVEKGVKMPSPYIRLLEELGLEEAGEEYAAYGLYMRLGAVFNLDSQQSYQLRGTKLEAFGLGATNDSDFFKGHIYQIFDQNILHLSEKFNTRRFGINLGKNFIKRKNIYLNLFFKKISYKNYLLQKINNFKNLNFTNRYFTVWAKKLRVGFNEKNSIELLKYPVTTNLVTHFANDLDNSIKNKFFENIFDVKLFKFQYGEDIETSFRPKRRVSYFMMRQKRYRRRKAALPHKSIALHKYDYNTGKKPSDIINKYYKVRPNLRYGCFIDEVIFSTYRSHKVLRRRRRKPDNITLLHSRRLLRTKRTLVLPVNVSMTAIATSRDVIHSWFIPGLGIKIDAIPGRSTHHSFSIDAVGFYYGQCAEICGRYHHHMPIRLCALPFEQFLIWWNFFGLPRILHGGVKRSDNRYFSNRRYNW